MVEGIDAKRPQGGLGEKLEGKEWKEGGDRQAEREYFNRLRNGERKDRFFFKPINLLFCRTFDDILSWQKNNCQCIAVLQTGSPLSTSLRYGIYIYIIFIFYIAPIHLLICLCVCVCLSVCLSVYMCLCLCVFMCVSVSACMCVSVCVCVCVYVCVCVCVFMSEPLGIL